MDILSKTNRSHCFNNLSKILHFQFLSHGLFSSSKLCVDLILIQIKLTNLNSSPRVLETNKWVLIKYQENQVWIKFILSLSHMKQTAEKGWLWVFPVARTRLKWFRRENCLDGACRSQNTKLKDHLRSDCTGHLDLCWFRSRNVQGNNICEKGFIENNWCRHSSCHKISHFLPEMKKKTNKEWPETPKKY